MERAGNAEKAKGFHKKRARMHPVPTNHRGEPLRREGGGVFRRGRIPTSPRPNNAAHCGVGNGQPGHRRGGLRKRRFRLLRCGLALALILGCLESTPVRAQDPYGCIDSLEDAEVRARNRWLERRFDARKRGIRLWWFGQTAIWAAVVGFQIVQLTRAEDTRRRFPNAVGLVGAALTLIQVAALPQPGAYAPQRFRRAPADTPAQRRAKLRYGLELLEGAASRQSLVGGPRAHLLPAAWTAFWTPYFGIRFRDPPQLALMALGGLALSEFRILTVPKGATRDWAQARSMICGADPVRDSRRHSQAYEDALPEEELPEEEWDDGLGDDEPVEPSAQNVFVTPLGFYMRF